MPARGRHIDLAGDLAVRLQIGKATLQAIVERIRHRPELDVAVGLERLGGRAGAAATAADEADLEHVVALSVSIGRDHRGRGGGGGLEEVAASGSHKKILSVVAHQQFKICASIPFKVLYLFLVDSPKSQAS